MPIHKKKRAYEKARPVSNTKLDLSTGKVDKRVRHVRVRGGNYKFRALRIKEGNFNWSSESTTKKARIINVVYNASNNELVRTNTLVKNCIVLIDATPFKAWYQNHYGVEVGPSISLLIQPRRKKPIRRKELPPPPRRSPRRGRSTYSPGLAAGRLTERSMPRLRSSSVSRDFWPASAQGLGSAGESTGTSWRARNSSSTPGRSTRRENPDSINI